MEILAVAVHRNAKCVEFVLEKSEGKTPYEMEYKEEGKEYELLYGTDGSLLQKDEEIEIQALPTLTGQPVGWVGAQRKPSDAGNSLGFVPQPSLLRAANTKRRLVFMPFEKRSTEESRLNSKERG
jgi:hypothetical protein